MLHIKHKAWYDDASKMLTDTIIIKHFHLIIIIYALPHLRLIPRWVREIHAFENLATD